MVGVVTVNRATIHVELLRQIAVGLAISALTPAQSTYNTFVGYTAVPFTMYEILLTAARLDASDVFLHAGRCSSMRIDKRVRFIDIWLDHAQMSILVNHLLDDEEKIARLKAERRIADLNYSIAGESSSFRVNIFYSERRGHTIMAKRESVDQGR